MMRSFLLFCALYFSSLAMYCQQGERPITAYFDYKYYYVPDEGRMIETYLKIVGTTTTHAQVSDTTVQAKVGIQLAITDGPKVIDVTNSTISGPLARKGYAPDFIDIQRFILPKGDYDIEIELTDLLADGRPAANLLQPIEMDYDIKGIFFSDIELVGGMRKSAENSLIGKSGMDIVPYMSSLYSNDFNEILFYLELYNTESVLGVDEFFLLKYSIEQADNSKVAEGCLRMNRLKTKEVITDMARFDISALRGGAYILKAEARDRNNELLAETSIPIVRQNDDAPPLTPDEIETTFVGDITDRDSLLAHIRSLTPIAMDGELIFIDNSLEARTLIELKSWFYDFWEQRNSIDPSQGWASYKQLVMEAEEQFGTRVKRGYRTDMGRVYCRYGPPNSIADEANDSESYPFQIWHYYKAGRYNGGRFVFYDQNLLLNDYTLLHSDVPGERKNPRWNRVIHSRNSAMNSFENNGSSSESGRRLQELYDTPR